MSVPDSEGGVAGHPVIVRDVAALRAAVRRFRANGERVALVPTLGALHEGHLALVRAGRERARRTVVSIFVNPTQFGPSEDVDRYPRTEAADIEKLRGIGTDVVFLPTLAEMYPPGFSTTVSVADLTSGLCGPFRPGHFAGVATVVSKLLLQALPDIAMFGEKDFQQLQVVRRVQRDLDIPVEIVGVPTVRESDGLALSSRNVYLSPAERRTAAILYRVISEIATGVTAGNPAGPLVAEGRRVLEEAGFGPVQYLEVADEATLNPVERPTAPARVIAAAFLGRTRLIDNVPVPRA
jgi:pantoate--beta-alanine ligase